MPTSWKKNQSQTVDKKLFVCGGFSCTYCRAFCTYYSVLYWSHSFPVELICCYTLRTSLTHRTLSPCICSVFLITSYSIKHFIIVYKCILLSICSEVFSLLKFILNLFFFFPKEADGTLDCISMALTCTFNRWGTLLAVGCNDGRIVIWDFLTRGIAKILSAHIHPVCSLW